MPKDLSIFVAIIFACPALFGFILIPNEYLKANNVNDTNNLIAIIYIFTQIIIYVICRLKKDIKST